MFIAFQNRENALKDYFNYYFYGLKLGLITVITGSTFLKTGTGKSYTALKLGELIDKDFSIEKVVYTPQEFLKAVDKIEENGRFGQVLVLDEGEVTVPAQMYQSFTNKAISYVLATFRYLRSMAILVTPSFYWLDKRIRILTSHYGYTEKLLTTNNKTEVYLRLYAVKTDTFGDQIYLRKIRMYDYVNKRIVVFNRFEVGLPSEELITSYEKKAQEFKSNLRKRLMPELEKWEKYQTVKEKTNLEEIINKITTDKNLLAELISKQGKIDLDILRMKFPNLNYQEARMVKKIVEKMWSGR